MVTKKLRYYNHHLTLKLGVILRIHLEVRLAKRKKFYNLLDASRGSHAKVSNSWEYRNKK